MEDRNCRQQSRCGLIIALNERIKKLEEEKKNLEFSLDDFKAKTFGKSRKQKEEDGKPRKKRGAPIGHKGWFRKTPEKIDIVEEVEIKQCPICGNADLKPCLDTEEHIQEDISVAKVIVTKYVKRKCWCNKCNAVVTGKGKEELPNSYIGPQAKALAVFLKYMVKVSDRDITRIFKELCGLNIVSSSVFGFNNQARRKSQPLYDGLKAEIIKAPYLHADETGCPVDGKNFWDWIFASTKICLHVISQSRGQKVVEEFLGKTYHGILISDFLSAYNKIETKAKQRCLVHLLREIKKILDCYKPEDFGYSYCQRLKDVLLVAIGLGKKYAEKQISQEQFAKEKEAVHQLINDFQFPDPQNKPIKRIAKRLDRHKNELFTFLDYPDVNLPCHNNFAEQLIRPSVLLRKITFGYRSEKGTLNHSVLMSIIQTGKLNDKQIIPLIKDILITVQKPAVQMCLGP